MTKKKNTGIQDSNQGHRAKMNSSDRYGLNQHIADGWTQALGKRSRRKLLRKQKHQEQESEEVSPPTPPTVVNEVLSDEDQVREESEDQHGSSKKRNSEKQHEAEHENVDADKARKPIMKSSQKKKKSVALDERLDNLIRNGETVKLRDVDPSVCAPDAKVIKQVVEMLRADPSQMPVLELGVPSTKRRERALTRLKNALSIKHMEAERLLTSSALAHTYGKQCFVHALAMGKYVRYGNNAEDMAETQRVYLREQLRRHGYTSMQVNLALRDLEASLGLWNVTATEVQGWLEMQEAAYNQRQAQAQAALKQQHEEKVSSTCSHSKGSGLGSRTGQTGHASPDNAGSIFSKPDEGSDSANANADTSDLTDAINWDKPPAVQKFLAIRQVVCQEALKLTKDMTETQLLKAFHSQVARFSTVLQAIQLFPKTCKIQLELSEILQREMDKTKINIQELELGGKLFLADVFERSTDRVMMMAEGLQPNRQLAEAEIQRAYKSCGDANEAVQLVVQLMKELSIPTPSWRKKVAEKPDTPRELGANGLGFRV
jgi:hypothetical protein